MRLLARLRMESRCGGTGPDVVILSGDFSGMERKSCFRVTRFHPSDEDLSPHPTDKDPSAGPRVAGDPGSRQEA